MNGDVRYSTVQTSAPAAEPISATEAKAHLGVTTATDDTLITRQIVAARRYVEQILQRQLITATWRLSLERFPREILVPYPPFGAVSSLTYIDAAGSSQTLTTDDYESDADAEPARIRPAYGTTWPAIREVYRPVRLTYTAGYGASGTSVPADILAAMYSIIAVMYAFRESVITGTIVARIEEVSDNFLWPYRIMGF